MKSSAPESTMARIMQPMMRPFRKAEKNYPNHPRARIACRIVEGKGGQLLLAQGHYEVWVDAYYCLNIAGEKDGEVLLEMPEQYAKDKALEVKS